MSYSSEIGIFQKLESSAQRVEIFEFGIHAHIILTWLDHFSFW